MRRAPAKARDDCDLGRTPFRSSHAFDEDTIFIPSNGESTPPQSAAASCTAPDQDHQEALTSLQSSMEGKDNGHGGIGVWHNGDQSAGVAWFVQPLHPGQRAAGHHKRVVPQGLIAQADLRAEPEIEAEGGLPVVGPGLVL